MKTQCMNIIFIFFLIPTILFSEHDKNQDSVFYYNNLVNWTEGGSMLSLNISSLNYKGKAVISNDLLFRYLYHNEYKEEFSEISDRKQRFQLIRNRYIKDLLQQYLNNDTLYIADCIKMENDEMHECLNIFVAIKKSSFVDSIYSKGHDYFLDYFFTMNNNKSEVFNTIRDDVFEIPSRTEDRISIIAAIIDKLFEMRLYSRTIGGKLLFSKEHPSPEFIKNMEKGLFE
jgi:hypothetical protein